MFIPMMQSRIYSPCLVNSSWIATCKLWMTVACHIMKVASLNPLLSSFQQEQTSQSLPSIITEGISSFGTHGQKTTSCRNADRY